MTIPDKNGDKEFKEYLAGGSAVTRAYRQHATDEPSAAVDETIRAAAKRAAHSRPRHISNPFGRHWTVPASMAAMLLLSVGLIIFMSDETGVTRFSSDILEEKVIERDLTQPAVMQDRFAGDKAASPVPSAPFANGAAGRRPEKKEMRIKPAVPVSSTDARKRLQSGSMSKTKQKSRVRREAGGIQTQLRLQKKAAPAASDAARPMLQMEMESSVESADSNIPAPEWWLAQIKTLRAEGKIKEANASLAEFRKAYPDYPLDSLRK